MRTFAFEYTDMKFFMKLLGWSFLTFFILLFSMVFTVELIGIVAGLILTFGVPTLIFYLNKKKIRNDGGATILDEFCEIKLTAASQNVVFANIKTYQIEHYNGAALRIWFRDGTKFKVVANSNFCDEGQFEIFCRELDGVLQQYRKDTNSDLTRKASMFDRV